VLYEYDYQILQLQPQLPTSSNVGARRPVAGPTVPVGPSTSTAPRCVGVEPMRRCAVTSTRHFGIDEDGEDGWRSFHLTMNTNSSRMFNPLKLSRNSQNGSKNV